MSGLEPLVAVVRLDGEVSEEVFEVLLEAVSARDVFASCRQGDGFPSQGVTMIAPPISDLREALGMVSWMVGAAHGSGLREALVVEAAVYSESVLRERYGS